MLNATMRVLHKLCTSFAQLRQRIKKEKVAQKEKKRLQKIKILKKQNKKNYKLYFTPYCIS